MMVVTEMRTSKTQVEPDVPIITNVKGLPSLVLLLVVGDIGCVEAVSITVSTELVGLSEEVAFRVDVKYCTIPMVVGFILVTVERAK